MRAPRLRSQAAVDDGEILCEVVGGCVRVGIEPPPHEGELAPVGLVAVLVADLLGVLGKLALVALDRREQVLVAPA